MTVRIGQGFGSAFKGSATHSAVIIDGPSAKTTEKGSRHRGAGNEVSGRERHVIADTMGLLLAVAAHAANIQDRDGARPMLLKLKDLLLRLRLTWAEDGYAGQLVGCAHKLDGWLLQIASRAEKNGFVVLPRRWVVEFTFARLGHCRRLSKEYEAKPQTDEAPIRIAMIQLMIHRLASE